MYTGSSRCFLLDHCVTHKFLLVAIVLLHYHLLPLLLQRSLLVLLLLQVSLGAKHQQYLLSKLIVELFVLLICYYSLRNVQSLQHVEHLGVQLLRKRKGFLEVLLPGVNWDIVLVLVVIVDQL